MSDNIKKIKTHDGLINASLSVPFLLATGNIIPAIGALAIGVLSDITHKNDFEKKQKEWLNNPNRYVQKTQKELHDNKECNLDSEVILEKIMNNANYIQGNVINGKGYNQKYIRIVFKYPKMNATCANNTECNVYFYTKVGDLNVKCVKSYCYYSASDFLARLEKDYCDNIEMYIITNAKRNEGRWMYTIDNGETYIVCL